MKNFDTWNELKKVIEIKERAPSDVGELWWCDIGLNVGSEQDGPSPIYERPVFIAKKFSNETCMIFPITSQKKFGSYYHSIDSKNTVILCQPKLVDFKRMKRLIKKLDRATTETILEAFKSLL